MPMKLFSSSETTKIIGDHILRLATEHRWNISKKHNNWRAQFDTRFLPPDPDSILRDGHRFNSAFKAWTFATAPVFGGDPCVTHVSGMGFWRVTTMSPKSEMHRNYLKYGFNSLSQMKLARCLALFNFFWVLKT